MIYEVYDSKAKIPIAVFIRSRDEDAVRSFEHLLSDPSDNVFTIAPEDFMLFALDPYADELDERVRLVKSGSDYSRLAIKQLRLQRAMNDDELFKAIGEAYVKLQKEKNDAK